MGRLFFCALGAAGAENGKRAAPGLGAARFWCAVLGPLQELRLTVHGCIRIIAQFEARVKASFRAARAPGAAVRSRRLPVQRPASPGPPAGGWGTGGGKGERLPTGRDFQERGGLDGMG